MTKPLGVLHRKRRVRVQNDDDDATQYDDLENANERLQSSESSKADVQWDIVAVVKKKIVFSKRPMPIANGLGSRKT